MEWEFFEPVPNQSRKSAVMRKVARLSACSALFAAVGVLASSSEARAAVPIEIEGGGFIGYGTNPSKGPNPFAVGIGARAGVDVYDLYAGLAITYYFGGSGNCGGGAPNSGEGMSSLPATYCGAGIGEVSLSQMSVLYGVDLGYTLSIPRVKYLKIRPLLELGDTEITRSGNVGASDVTAGALSQYHSVNSFYAQPGLLVFLTVSGFFIGADANLLLVPGVLDITGAGANMDGTGNLTTEKRTFVAFTTHAQIGFRF
jgi:hypothetical protein